MHSNEPLTEQTTTSESSSEPQQSEIEVVTTSSSSQARNSTPSIEELQKTDFTAIGKETEGIITTVGELIVGIAALAPKYKIIGGHLLGAFKEIFSCCFKAGHKDGNDIKATSIMDTMPDTSAESTDPMNADSAPSH